MTRKSGACDELPPGRSRPDGKTGCGGLGRLPRRRRAGAGNDGSAPGHLDRIGRGPGSCCRSTGSLFDEPGADSSICAMRDRSSRCLDRPGAGNASGDRSAHRPLRLSRRNARLNAAAHNQPAPCAVLVSIYPKKFRILCSNGYRALDRAMLHRSIGWGTNRPDERYDFPTTATVMDRAAGLGTSPPSRSHDRGSYRRRRLA